AIYRRSDALKQIRLPQPSALWPQVEKLRTALAADARPAVQTAAQALCLGACGMLDVAPVRVEVLALRPRFTGGELHGLYRPAEDRRLASIQVWMRTAARGRVVAFRTFLRTLLHELVHHLDMTLLGFECSFHTQGFFQRESSIFHQL